jgi:hypothetical protein
MVVICLLGASVIDQGLAFGGGSYQGGDGGVEGAGQAGAGPVKTGGGVVGEEGI